MSLNGYTRPWPQWVSLSLAPEPNCWLRLQTCDRTTTACAARLTPMLDAFSFPVELQCRRRRLVATSECATIARGRCL